MTQELDLRNCRGPFCKYKAPVCSYGYCGECCHKHHNFMNMGASWTNHVAPVLLPIQYGFKVVERGGPARSTAVLHETPEPLVVPVLGALEAITEAEYPIEVTIHRNPSF